MSTTNVTKPLSVVDATGAAKNGQPDAEQRAKAREERRERVLKLEMKGWKVDLSDGQTATLCDPKTVTEAQRSSFKNAGLRTRALEEALDRALKQGHMPLELVNRLAEEAGNGDRRIIVMFLRDWTLPFPMPTADNLFPLGELPSGDFDTLFMACADLLEDLFVNLDNSEDPTSPKVASSG